MAYHGYEPAKVAVEVGDGSITTAKLDADAVTAAKIADDVIAAEHYASGSVDATALGADAVTAAKIGDNILDSEHYAAISIDNEHLADNAADTAEIADNAVTIAKMAGLARGKIIYGDSSGDPAALALGTDNHVLTVNGSDINWEATQSSAAAAGTLTGSTLASGVTASSLTSTGTIAAFRSTGIDDNANALAMTITSLEAFGLRTTDPDSMLHILGNHDAGGKFPAINIESDDSDNATRTWRFRIDATEWGSFAIEQSTAKAGNTFTKHFCIDENGNVGIGTASPSGTFEVHDGTDVMFRVKEDGGGQAPAFVGVNCDPDSIFVVKGNSGGGWQSKFVSSSGGPENMLIHSSDSHQDSHSYRYLECSDDQVPRLKIYADGDIENHDNSYGSLSDERIKVDITDAGSQWDDIKAIRVRKFKRKDDVTQYGENAWEQIGVVAQEVEAAGMDKLIEHNEPSQFEIDNCGIAEDDKVKGMKYSVLYMKAIKALQECMARIEALESA